MPKILDLSPEALAKHATNVIVCWGFHQVGASLVFSALKLNPFQGEALINLAQYLDEKPTQVMSAIILEFALRLESPISKDERKKIDDHLFRCKWFWGFSKHAQGIKELKLKDFLDRSQFIIDEKNYRSFIDNFINSVGSLEKAAEGVLTYFGKRTGFLRNKSAKEKPSFNDYCESKNWEVTPAYYEFTQRDTTDLDELENKRKQASRAV